MPMNANGRSPDASGAGNGEPRGWHISILTALVGGIGGLVLLAVGAVLAVGWFTGIRNTSDLLNDKSTLLVRNLEGPVRSHLEPARQQIDYLGNLIERRRLATGSDAALVPILEGSLAAAPQIAAVVFVSPDFRELVVARDAKGFPFAAWRDASSDPLIEAGVAQARDRTGSYWWKPVYVQNRKTTFANVQRPIRIDGEYAGLLIVAVSMQELSRLVADSSQRDNVTNYILSDDRILAHPLLVNDHPALSAASPTVARDSIGDAVMGSLSRATAVDGFSRAARQGVAVRVLEDRNEARWVIFSKALDGFDGMKLDVGAYTPRDHVDQELNRLIWSVVVGLLVLALAVLLAVLLARAIAAPIRRMAESAKAIGALDFEKAGFLPDGRIQELSEQSVAFNAMLRALRWFEMYVPRALVRKLVARGEAVMPSETREVAVMFADIVGFSSLTENEAAERTASMLNDHFALIAAPIEANDGVIDKFIGDCIMAFWVSDSADPATTARRAVSAARVIAADLDAANRGKAARGEPPVRIRIGLHMGSALVGNIGSPGRINYTIVGGAVNVAQRIEQIARDFDGGSAAATIVISADVARHLDPSECEPLGERELKGLAETQRLYGLRDVVSPDVRSPRAVTA